MDNMEKHIGDQLRNFEVPYNPSDWTALEKKLDLLEGNNKNTSKKSWKKWGIGGVILIVSSGVLCWFLMHDNQREDAVSQTPLELTQPFNVKTKNDQLKQDKEVFNKPEKEDKPEEIKGKNSNPVAKNRELLEDNQVVEFKKMNNNEVLETMVLESKTKEKSPKTELEAKVILQKSDFKLIADKYSICTGDLIKLNLLGGDLALQNGYTILWNMGNEWQGKNQSSYKYKFAEVGNHKVVVQIQRQHEKMEIALDELITVSPMPRNEVIINASGEDPYNPYHEFEFDLDPSAMVHWSFGDGSFGKGAVVQHTFSRRGNYAVVCDITNLYGCTSKKEFTIVIDKDYNLMASNAFTPNGDGENDTWLPEALIYGQYASFDLSIYNRKGQKVFGSSNKGFKWDGQIEGKNEKALPGDVFIWVAKVKTQGGEELIYQSEIAVVR